MGYFVLRYFAEALGFTRPAMFIALFALALKIPLNYIFMYGMFGLPERGGVGCGYATAIVMWLEFVLITVVVLSARFRHIGWQAKFSKPNLARMSRLLRIGLPIGATMFFEMGLFTSVTLMAGRLGADVVASHTIAMNVGGITFMFPLAIGIAASIRIGFNVGADKLDAARTVAKIAMLATVIIGVISIGAVVALRYSIAAIYTNDPGVLELAATLMLFVAVFQLFDNCQATAIGALRGYKDTYVDYVTGLLDVWFSLSCGIRFWLVWRCPWCLRVLVGAYSRTCGRVHICLIKIILAKQKRSSHSAVIGTLRSKFFTPGKGNGCQS
jgi:MATE family multidrug resistance protein